MTRTDAILTAIKALVEDHRLFLDSSANVTSVQLTVKIKRGTIEPRASLFSAQCEGIPASD